MALKITKKDNRCLARLVTGERKPCAFCLREVDDEVTYGKLYAIGDIQCHYFCCLLSCCLIQKGHDEEGLFGFMYPDILAEVERCKKHKCSYCNRNGANLGCSVGVCRKQFHLPCGREKNAISLYYGTYKTYCQLHAPKQKVPDHIMEKAKLRKKADRMKIRNAIQPNKNIQNTAILEKDNEVEPTESMVCVICYEEVDGFPTIHTFWPPCCARDAWFHRSCLQRMALSAGMHYLKCPLCNDKENFHEAVVSQGYYVPDRDAAWELEQNAFAEIYERPTFCGADACACPNGREHDSENGQWDIKLCLLCGSTGIHAQCLVDEPQPRTENIDQSQTLTNDEKTNQIEEAIDVSRMTLTQSEISRRLSDDQSRPSIEEARNVDKQALKDGTTLSPERSQAFPLRFVCRSCKPVAPEDLNSLVSSIEAIIQQEQAAAATNPLRPVMPSRMSLRRTKGRRIGLNTTSSSRSEREIESETPNVRSSRRELNLKSPRKPSYIETAISRDTDIKILSPTKLLEQTFREKVQHTGFRDAVLDESIIATLKRKFRKPRPMCEKRRIVNNILDGHFDGLIKGAPKQKDQIREWCSPKKTYEMMEESKDKTITGASIALDVNNKENDSTTSTKEANSSKAETNLVTTVNNFNKSENGDENCDVSDMGEIGKACTRMDEKQSKNTITKNNVEEETVIEAKVSRNVNEKQITRNNSTKTGIENKETKFEETPKNAVKRECRNTRNSLSKPNTEILELEATQAKILNENWRLTRSSLSKIFDDKTNGDPSADKFIITEDVGSLISNEESGKTKNSSIKIIDSDNTNTALVNLATKIFKTPVNSNKSNSLSKARISAKNSPSRKESRKKTSKISKYTKMVDDTKQHCEFLKNLLTEEDLCAKLLSELTRNQKSVQSNHSPNKLMDASIIETTNNPRDASNELVEIPNDLADSQNTISHSPNTLIASPQTTTVPENTLTEPSSTLISASNTLTALSNTLTEYPDALTEIRNTLSEIPNQIMETPKRKTIDIQQDSSLEISENDQSINIDVIKIEDTTFNTDPYKNLNINLLEKAKTCAFKFSTVDKETLKTHNVDIDLESFKKEYLSEVDREFSGHLKHKYIENGMPMIKSVIKFESDDVFKKELSSENVTSMMQRKKRNMSETADNVATEKKRKLSESGLKLTYNLDIQDTGIVNTDVKSAVDATDKKQDKKSAKDKRRKRKTKDRRRVKKYKRKCADDKNIEVTIDSSENRRGGNKRMKKKIKTKFAIRNDNIHVKIKWKKKQLSLNIASKKQDRKEKKEKRSEKSPKLKQYVLQFPEGSSKDLLVRPEKDVGSLKRKYVRQEKSSDKMKQTSIQSFFKVNSPEK